MAYFELENEVNSALRMDHTIPRGPLLHSQRCEQSNSNSATNLSLNTSSSAVKTPCKALSKEYSSTAKTPSRTPSSTGRKKTPSNRSKTPSTADRFIPVRSSTQFDAAHYKICTQTESSAVQWSLMSPSQQEYRQLMNENLNGDTLQKKIISFNEKPPMAPEGYHNSLQVLYSTSKVGASCKKTTRHIPQQPDRILDAPDILDDYYLSLIDWSSQNMLAVALGSSVYLWNASKGEITLLLQLSEVGGDYVSCVNWTADSNHLAVGLSSGCVELWDASQQKKLRTMSGHAARVGALDWNSYLLSSGSRSGSIHHHDVRVAEHQVGTLLGHTQEVCGLKWSPNGRHLASGGNDNVLNIWPATSGSFTTAAEPLYTFNQHQSAVKALAWCPWQPNVLASGGGTADRHIRFWNCNNGTSLSSVDTNSQVCALLWSVDYKELVSGHGYMHNQLILWKYPAMSKVAELTGHTGRVLHMCLSPDGTTVVSAGADETLRLWKCFEVDAKTKKTKTKAESKDSTSCLRLHLR
ncbi:cell division cycle protein 20 homolog [Physella acuta]|uniref:cell division cycle protein 20 homolog n=1 Tax=Physella acuta TaxID=109671 RepID=UPI0027DBAE20|nr:cell division cycle protein 20 homolog [Physella acuta]XP_059155275.1 cell division cycle protein 20 homolog [Physella acuta]XP_059155276.1 cell division cycle protein 20 homolog [Physella acuta]XP_059155277.1 cell division cycle protein 20 homolog [Physella acuta]